MRRLQPKDKDRRNVPVPPELRESLREVHELIQEAKRDPDIELGYDDAIQVGAVCGGRFGTKRRPFVLTYYPEGGGERDRWYLTLHRTDIEDIGDGLMTEITLYCCAGPDCRCKFREADDHCFYCDYTDDQNYGTFDFPEAERRLLDRGITDISESSSRAAVIAALGSPDAIGGGTNSPPSGYIWPWITYRRPDCQLRFEFDRVAERVRGVTIVEWDWQPGE